MEKSKNQERTRPATTISILPAVLSKAKEVAALYRGGKSEYIETLILADLKKRGISLT